MFNNNYKQLAATIILQTCRDLDEICGKIKNVRKHCATGTLTDYMTTTLKRKTWRNYIPFTTEYDNTAIMFFFPDNCWARTLLEICGIHNTPEDIEKKLAYIKTAYQYCKPCLDRLIAITLKE